MCAQYWTLLAPVKVSCGHEIAEWQTHWTGEAIGLEYRRIGQLIAHEVKAFTGKLSAEGDGFIGECRQCAEFYKCDAQIDSGRVVRLLSVVAH